MGGWAEIASPPGLYPANGSGWSSSRDAILKNRSAAGDRPNPLPMLRSRAAASDAIPTAGCRRRHPVSGVVTTELVHPHRGHDAELVERKHDPLPFRQGFRAEPWRCFECRPLKVGWCRDQPIAGVAARADAGEQFQLRRERVSVQPYRESLTSSAGAGQHHSRRHNAASGPLRGRSERSV